MFQQTVYAQYGNKRSFYGNIQLGAAPKFLQNYGAWPEWTEPTKIIKEEIISNAYKEEIDTRISIIKRLKDSLKAENDNVQKNIIREHLELERSAKERAFKLKARLERIDEDESTFILLN